MARSLLQRFVRETVRLRYTVESHPITSEHRDGRAEPPRRLTIEAADSEQAINSFAEIDGAEVTSIVRPRAGRESIATVRKSGGVYVVRVYPGA